MFVNSSPNIYISIEYIGTRILIHIDIEFNLIYWSLHRIQLRYCMKVWFLLFSFENWRIFDWVGWKKKKDFLSTLLTFFLFPYIKNSIKMQLSPRTKCLLCLISLVWSVFVLILPFIRVVFSSANCPKPMLFWIQS